MRRQIRRAVALLHETHDRVPYDPHTYIATKMSIEQLARLVCEKRVSIHRLYPQLRRDLRVWGERNGVLFP